MEHKYQNEVTFIGTHLSKGVTHNFMGRNKREAEKRARATFAKEGIPTLIRSKSDNPMDLAYVDLLELEMA